MEKENVTNRMAAYISEQGLQIAEISRVTGVPESKLYCGTMQELDAAEFLEVCSYLDVRPENFR